MDATYYKYAPPGVGPLDQSLFTDPAPLLYDGSPGDLTTGYSPGDTGANYNYGPGYGYSYGNSLCVLIDLGPTPATITAFSASVTGGDATGYTLYSSFDGTAWTNQASAAGAPSGDAQPLEARSARYWQYCQHGDASTVLTDYRLYDANGNASGTGEAGPHVQVTIGGPAVNVPMIVSGDGPHGTSPAVGRFQVVDGAGSPFTGASISYPPSGTSTIIGNLAFFNTGMTAMVGSHAFPLISVQALAGAAAGTGYALEETQELPAYGLFDVLEPDPSTLPVTPTGVTATGSASGDLIVSFNAGNTAVQPAGTTYSLLRGTAPGAEAVSPVSSMIASLPFSYHEQAPGTYYYQLTATNTGRVSPPSAEVSATVTVPLPGPVGQLAAVLADDGVSPSPTLTWAAPTTGSPATGYNIFRGTAAGMPGSSPLNPAPLPADANTYADNTAAYNQEYYYSVQTLALRGSASSAEMHLKTDTSAPTNLTVTAISGANNLTWINAPGAVATLIETSTNGISGWSSLIIRGSGIASYADTSAVKGAQKFYRVRNLN